MIGFLQHSTKVLKSALILLVNEVRTNAGDFFCRKTKRRFIFCFLGDERCLGYRVDRESGYQWLTYEEVNSTLIQFSRQSFDFSDKSSCDRSGQWTYLLR